MSIASEPDSKPGAMLFHDLLDDAAMFPPAEHSAAEALARHRVWRAGGDAEFVGPLLVPAAGWDGFVAAHDRDPAPVDVMVIGTSSEPARVPDGVGVVGYELRSPDATVPDVAARLAVEPAKLDQVEDLLADIGERRIDGQPVVAKFRTGGITADAFPNEDDLAYCILASFNAGVPFKLTAGLHHPVRHTDGSTGFEHHGFLNVMLAVSRCLAGAAEYDVAEALAVRESADVVAEVRTWTEDDVIAVRSVFLSFGCCAVDEPLADLRTLGLLSGAER